VERGGGGKKRGGKSSTLITKKRGKEKGCCKKRFSRPMGGREKGKKLLNSRWLRGKKGQILLQKKRKRGTRVRKRGNKTILLEGKGEKKKSSNSTKKGKGGKEG